MTGVVFSGRTLGRSDSSWFASCCPRATTIAVLHNSRNPIRESELSDLQHGASALGQQISIVSAGSIAEIDRVLLSLIVCARTH